MWEEFILDFGFYKLEDPRLVLVLPKTGSVEQNPKRNGKRIKVMVPTAMYNYKVNLHCHSSSNDAK